MKIQFIIMVAILVAVFERASARPHVKEKRSLTEKEKKTLAKVLLKTFHPKRKKTVHVPSNKKHEIGTETLPEAHLSKIALGGGLAAPPSISSVLPAAAQAPLMTNGIPASYGEAVHNLFRQHPMFNVPHIGGLSAPLNHGVLSELYGVHIGRYRVPSHILPEFVWDHSTDVSGDNGPGTVFIGSHHGTHGRHLLSPYYRHSVHIAPQAPGIGAPSETHNKDAAFHAAMRQYAYEEAKFAHAHGFHPYQYLGGPVTATVHNGLNYIDPEGDYDQETMPVNYRPWPLIADTYIMEDY